MEDREPCYWFGLSLEPGNELREVEGPHANKLCVCVCERERERGGGGEGGRGEFLWSAYFHTYIHVVNSAF